MLIMAQRVPNAVARRDALKARRRGGALTGEQTINIALEAQHWAHRKPKARATAK